MIIWIHPGHFNPISAPTLGGFTAHTACKVAELKKKISSHSGEMLQDSSASLKSVASATIPGKLMCVESNCPPLSHFVVYHIRQTAAVHGIKAWARGQMESPILPKKLRGLC